MNATSLTSVSEGQKSPRSPAPPSDLFQIDQRWLSYPFVRLYAFLFPFFFFLTRLRYTLFRHTCIPIPHNRLSGSASTSASRRREPKISGLTINDLVDGTLMPLSRKSCAALASPSCRCHPRVSLWVVVNVLLSFTRYVHQKSRQTINPQSDPKSNHNPTPDNPAHAQSTP